MFDQNNTASGKIIVEIYDQLSLLEYKELESRVYVSIHRR